jgi:hypothetical protein
MVAIAKSPIKEVVFYGDTDLWFKCKVTYELMDEDTEKVKKLTLYLLVNASDAREAFDRTTEHLKEMLVPFQIPKVEETKIADVYQYQQGLRPRKTHVTDKAADLRNEAVKREPIGFKVAQSPIASLQGGLDADALEARHLGAMGDSSVVDWPKEKDIQQVKDAADSLLIYHPTNGNPHKDWLASLPNQHSARVRKQFLDLYVKHRQPEFRQWMKATHGIEGPQYDGAVRALIKIEDICQHCEYSKAHQEFNELMVCKQCFDHLADESHGSNEEEE